MLVRGLKPRLDEHNHGRAEATGQTVAPQEVQNKLNMARHMST
jgi:hypothetical protein